ncbi:hypothetical protein LCGC14_1836500 [marine sediment metagenome]|uniref:Uncharacterized protein n=1 Tax=marine sediment metagenome TaxID=412755 RepID=A0A0F9GEN6_9ZZZZ
MVHPRRKDTVAGRATKRQNVTQTQRRKANLKRLKSSGRK